MIMPESMAWELRRIRKTFGPAVANDDVSLLLRAGEIHGLVGENGSGKIHADQDAQRCTPTGFR
ncbi:hypothetical protein MTX20_28895 [Bradyrhizobium sp. ISRA435]|nr:hypothetical protein MTX20_28895 [Bradyrhizobium sp. ISRA435]